MDLRKRSKKEKDLTYDIEVLVNKLINKQKDLEYLINTRNFIFFVKNRGKNVIKMDNVYVYRISKRRKFIDNLFDLLGCSTDSLAFN
jgi:predicted patatin/cPLA2 family phospholipase